MNEASCCGVSCSTTPGNIPVMVLISLRFLSSIISSSGYPPREALNKSPLLATRSRRQRVADMFMSVIQAMNADSPDKASQPEVPKTVSSSEGDIACLTSLDYSTIFKECVKAVQQQVAPTTERRWVAVNC
mmetsp:Transcript_14587/g.12459  ORF Transcript_14587/g.12459 Transcript_14587/m.12459 type:complete len:131 (-) Transcript_14587:187-579(-)